MAAQHDERQRIKRRGLIAGAAALVAGIAMKQTRVPVAAATGGAQGTALILGANYTSGTANTSTQTTQLFHNGGTVSSYYIADAFVAAASDGGIGVQGKSSANGIGVYGTVYPDNVDARGVYGSAGAGNGVRGIAVTGTGVYGESGGDSQSKAIHGKHTASGYAVYGEATASFGYGVTGVSTNAFGVLGQSTSGTAVQGQILNTSSAENTNAMIGSNQSTGAGGNGVFGTSAKGYGVLGYSTGGSASLSGISTNANIPAFAGGNSVAGGLAASFGGTVYVNGMFVVADMTQKHGLLKHPDGSHRLMYTMEAPESWAEDFGMGTLAGGKAEIKLDPDFAALIHTEDYHVFLTEHAHHHLAVTQRGASGFTVAANLELAKVTGKLATDLSGTFSWRVVAKPKSDHKGERLGKFVVPNIPLPDVSKLKAPEISAVPKKP